MPDLLPLAPLRELVAKLGSSIGPDTDWLSVFQEPVVENRSHGLRVEPLQWSDQSPSRIPVGEDQVFLSVLLAEVNADRFEWTGCDCCDLRLQSIFLQYCREKCST